MAVSKPLGFFFPTQLPAHARSTKYTEVEGYKLPSLLVLGAQTSGERSPLSSLVLNKPRILQGLPELLGSSIGILSRFHNIWFPDREAQPCGPSNGEGAPCLIFGGQSPARCPVASDRPCGRCSAGLKEDLAGEEWVPTMSDSGKARGPRTRQGHQ